MRTLRDGVYVRDDRIAFQLAETSIGGESAVLVGPDRHGLDLAVSALR